MTYNFWCTFQPHHARVAGNVPRRLRWQRLGLTSCTALGWSNEVGRPALFRIDLEVHLDLEEAGVDVQRRTLWARATISWSAAGYGRGFSFSSCNRM